MNGPRKLLLLVLAIVLIVPLVGLCGCTSPAEKHSDNADALRSEGRYDEAIAEYNKAIELDPEEEIYYFQRASTLENVRRYALAIADYSQVIELDPTGFLSFAAYYRRGTLYYNQGQLDMAIADYSQTIELDPENADAYYSRGVSYYDKKQYNLAIDDFNKVLALSSDPELTGKAKEKLASLGTISDEEKTKPNILTGARWSLRYGGAREVAEVTWVNRNGEKVQSLAIYGEFQIIVEPVCGLTDEVKDIVWSNGGKIFAELPMLGLYWVKVDSACESTFIENARPYVNDVMPNIVLQTRQLPLPMNYDYQASKTDPFGVTSGNLIIDNFLEPMKSIGKDKQGNNLYIMKNSDGSPALDRNGDFLETTDISKAVSHGAMSNYYRTKGLSQQTLGSKHTMDVITEAPMSDMILGLAALIKGASAIDERAVINCSLGATEYSGDKQLLESEDKEEKAMYNANWETYNQINNSIYLQTLITMLNSNVPGADDAVIVCAAGNGSTDLTSTLVNQLSIDPRRSSQVIPVGALDESGNIASYSNYSTSPDTMIYVPVTDKTASGLSVGGTSFAAPQLQHLIAQILKERPDLTAEQLRQVLFDKSVAKTKTVQHPALPGKTMTIRVIENPYDNNLLATALAVADKKFPPKEVDKPETDDNVAVTGSVTISPSSATIDLEGKRMLLLSSLLDGFPIDSQRYAVQWYVGDPKGKPILTGNSLTGQPFIEAIGNKPGTYTVSVMVIDRTAVIEVGRAYATVVAKGEEEPETDMGTHWVSAVPGKGLINREVIYQGNPPWSEAGPFMETGVWEAYEVELSIQGSTGSITTILRDAAWKDVDYMKDTFDALVGKPHTGIIRDWKDSGAAVDFTWYDSADSRTLTVHLTRSTSGGLTGSAVWLVPNSVSTSKFIFDLVPAP